MTETNGKMSKMETIQNQRICPVCGGNLEFNLTYGTDDCTSCGHVEGNSD